MLNNLLGEYCPEIEVLESCGSASEAANSILQHQPDIVFLDVEMHNETGFDLLKNLKEVKFDVIFTTAHEKYAIQAIRFSALDYLMKPILAEELKKSISRVFEKGSANKEKHLDALIYNINYTNADKKLALPTANGYMFISISDIVRCEASDNYTYFYLADKSKILVSKTLMEYERLLSNYYFFRTHQSHLVNLRRISFYEKGEGGILFMNDDSKVEVSRRRKTQLIDAISEFAIMSGH